MELRVARRVSGNLVKRLEYVDDDLFEGVHLFVGFIHAEQSRDLYEPSYIVRDQLVIDDPSSELLPFVNGSAIDGDSPFNKLVFAGFQVRDDLLCDFSEVASFDIVVSLQKDFSESRLPNGIVFEVELVKAMEGISVGLLPGLV